MKLVAFGYSVLVVSLFLASTEAKAECDCPVGIFGDCANYSCKVEFTGNSTGSYRFVGSYPCSGGGSANFYVWVEQCDAALNYNCSGPPTNECWYNLECIKCSRTTWEDGPLGCSPAYPTDPTSFSIPKMGWCCDIAGHWAIHAGHYHYCGS